jgi:SPX domain protein involved in polyphosphate accumulation
MAGTNKLPGVTFGVEYSALTEKRGVVHIGAFVEDEELWQKVLKKLNGMKLYAGVSLEQAFVESLEQDLEKVKKEHEAEVMNLRRELEQAKQRLSVLEKKNAEFEEFEEALRALAKGAEVG